MQQNITRTMEFRRKTQELKETSKKFDSSKFSGVKIGKKIFAMACSTGGPKILTTGYTIASQNLMRQLYWFSICLPDLQLHLASKDWIEMGDISRRSLDEMF